MRVLRSVEIDLVPPSVRLSRQVDSEMAHDPKKTATRIHQQLESVERNPRARATAYRPC